MSSGDFNIGQVKQNTAIFLYVYLVDATDGYTPETGVSGPTITISKNGGAFAAPSDGTWSELASGWYKVALNATDTNTLGPLTINVAAACCRNFVDTVEVVSGTVGEVDTNVDTLITRIPAEVAQKAHLVNGSGDIAPPTDKGLWDVLGDGTVSLNTLDTLILRVLGLSKENSYSDSMVYSSGKLTSARLRIYDTAANVGTGTGVVATYNITVTYSGNEVATFKIVKA